VNGTEITSSIRDVLNQDVLETEKVVEIIYQPQAIFRVRAVSRCTSTITGMYGYDYLLRFSESVNE
jgi:ribosome assembly protein 4